MGAALTSNFMNGALSIWRARIAEPGALAGAVAFAQDALAGAVAFTRDALAGAVAFTQDARGPTEGERPR
ncbi:hypothetical protein [Sorangium sp. So ce1097]|uniref:hypothetical protein n=1 Tax=Sorangium sp. So ce1097 TaxID=3133330 RepID=UPI003F5DD0B2